jgi:hypothetical protein
MPTPAPTPDSAATPTSASAPMSTPSTVSTFIDGMDIEPFEDEDEVPYFAPF